MITADLHMHSTASDGTDSPRALRENAEKAGLRIAALTDHDTTAGWQEWTAAAPESSLIRIPGIEFTCMADYGKCHILGFCADENAPAFQAALAESAGLRRSKNHRRLDWLREQGMTFPQAEIDKLFEAPSVGKPQLADLIVRYGYAQQKDKALWDLLERAPGGTTRIPAKTAVEAIRAGGGIPVWAHPLGGIGERRISKQEFLGLLGELIGYGLRGLECWYSEYRCQQCQELQETAEDRGLLVSGGSDYHGTVKKVRLSTLNAEGSLCRQSASPC